MKKNQPIIGLEVHVELATKSKMFCGCPADHFSKIPNTQTCPVCLGLPGALPVPNKKAIDWTVMLALALECKINLESHFYRKNYFYPDLAKGYQITQYERPFGYEGELTLGHSGARRAIESSKEKDPIASLQDDEKVIRIRRVHLEEDTGKLQHHEGVTTVDFNRSGVPLVEIVTEPDFRSIDEVDLYLKKLQRIIRYLGISNADMEKGSMRLEPSISIITNQSNDQLQFPIPNDQLPKYRVELKNINSFRFVRKALEYEINRQQNEPHILQTRGWDSVKNVTFPQREKEEAHDYRYFPEPDIPPIAISNEQWAMIKSQIPELPEAKLRRFVEQYQITEYEANILCETREVADYFEECVRRAPKDRSAKQIANIIINKSGDPLEATKKNDEVSPAVIEAVLKENAKAVEDYKNGKTGVIMFLVGQVRRKNNADPAKIRALLEKQLT